MNEKFLELLHKIVKDEKLLDEIVKIESFDKLYDIIINIQSDLNINKKELKDFVEKYAEELNENQLSEIAGGVKDLKSKIIPSVAASMLSLLIMGQMGASAVGNERTGSEPVSAVNSKQEEQEQGFISRNIGKLTAGAAFLTAAGVYMFFPRSAPAKPVPAKPVPAKPVPVKPVPAKPVPAELSQGGKEIIDQLPDAWMEFWRAMNIARGTIEVLAYNMAEGYVKGATAIKSPDQLSGAVNYFRAYYTAHAAAESMAELYPNSLHFAAQKRYAFYSTFAKAWRRSPEGAAYILVKEQPIEYFRNLLEVLRSETIRINAMLAQSKLMRK